jgi:hypothetical protein
MSWITIPLMLTVVSFGPAEQLTKPSAALPGSTKIERYAAQAQKQKQAKLEQIENDLRAATEQLAFIKRARVGRPKTIQSWNAIMKCWTDDAGQYWFKDGDAKRATLKIADQNMRDLKERLLATKNQTHFLPEITYGGLKVGNMGRFDPKSALQMTVFQVIGDDEALVQFWHWSSTQIVVGTRESRFLTSPRVRSHEEKVNDQLVWFRGINASKLIDGEQFKPHGLFEIIGTDTYITAIGSTKTVLVAEPLLLPETSSKNAQPGHLPG